MERTAIEQNTKFQKSLNQAQIDGVAIKARVTDKKSGALLGFIVKGKANSEYRVEVKDGALTCNCRAGELGNYCKHRAICTQNEMERKAAENAAQEDAEYEASVYQAERDEYQRLEFERELQDAKEDGARANALPARRDGGPRLYRDDAPRVPVTALAERSMEEW